jgi:tetratricopeptide (TPR) repeat protein
MTDNPRLAKVSILLSQQKYNEAGQLLKELLAEDANDIRYLTLLAEVYLQQGKPDAARTVIDSAIGLAPGEPHLFYIKSRIALEQDNYDEAEQLIQQAIALEPYGADYFAWFSTIKLSRKQFQEALELSEKALEIDAQHLAALNMRSTALQKLNRPEESFLTIEGALREDANNPYTHANYGWGLLERGQHKKALEHFKEALKHDPNNEYARSGMVEALKAANPVYRLFLKYAFFMGNLTARYQWAVIIGIYVAFRVLRALERNNETLRPFLTPLTLLIGIFAFSTWVITPLSDLLLRLNPYGKFLLSRHQKISSNFVGVSLLVFLAGVALYLVTGQAPWLALTGYGFAMMPPFSVMFATTRPRHVLLFYAIAMGVIGAVAVVAAFTTGEPLNTFSAIFIIGFIAFQFVANFLAIREDNR